MRELPEPNEVRWAPVIVGESKILCAEGKDSPLDQRSSTFIRLWIQGLVLLSQLTCGTSKKMGWDKRKKNKDPKESKHEHDD